VIYDDLCRRRHDTNDESVSVEKIPGFPWARIGVAGQKVTLLLPPEGLKLLAEHELEYISIRPFVEFRVHGDVDGRIETAAIVETKSRDAWLVQSFLQLIAMLFDTGIQPSPTSVQQLLDDLVALFRALTQPPLKSVIGLWGELFIILRSSEPQQLVGAWHVTPLDKFDFTSNHERIEVKTTTGPRIHNFSHDQLSMPAGISVTIASVVLTPDTDGMNCAELAEAILIRLNDVAHKKKFLEQVVRTLGQDWRSQDSEKFDVNQAKLAIKFFDARAIPRVLDPIPPQVSALKYQVDLQGVADLTIADIDARDILTLAAW
jgi:hypothetical protein